MSYQLPETLRTQDDARTVTYLQRYFGSDGGSRYDGSYSDEWAQPQDPEQSTADDVVAVSFLSVFVPPMAARQLLQIEQAQFARLLADIGPDRYLTTESQPLTRCIRCDG